MKIGHSRCLLTPQGEFYLIGYRSENRMYPASGVHDDIYANALLFDDGEKEIFLFSADVLEFEEEMAEDVKSILQDRYGLDRDAVLLAATHNHSSIVSYHKGWYTKKFDPGYYTWFVDAICKCYEECASNKQTASAKYGKKTILGYYGNRNHPGTPADNEIIVVKFYDVQDQPFAGLVNWAVHSTVISAENTYLTAELAGNVSKELEASFGFYPAMVVGAAGDCSNRNERQGNDFNELKRVSKALAKEIQDIEITQNVQLDTIQLQTVFHTIHHDMAFVHEELRKEIKKCEETLCKENEHKKQTALRKKITSMSEELNCHHFHLDAKAWAIQLGEIQLIVFPGELGSCFGIELKEQYSGLAIVCGYTNGYYEYFMKKEEYGLSFETIGCKVPKGEPEKLIEKLKQASRLLYEDRNYDKKHR